MNQLDTMSAAEYLEYCKTGKLPGKKQSAPKYHNRRTEYGLSLIHILTENRCHDRYDNGTREEHEEIGRRIREYLMSKYPDWDESKLIYTKWG